MVGKPKNKKIKIYKTKSLLNLAHFEFFLVCHLNLYVCSVVYICCVVCICVCVRVSLNTLKVNCENGTHEYQSVFGAKKKKPNKKMSV